MRRLVWRGSVGATILSLVMTGYAWLKVEERDRHLDALIARATEGEALTDPTQIALALSKEIYSRTNATVDREALDWYSRLESVSPFNVTTAVSLRYGAYGVEDHSTLGACGTMSRTLLNALWHLGVPARKLQLFQPVGDGHTLVEFDCGGRWCVISPADRGFVWRNRSGAVASAAEIRADEQVYRQVFEIDPAYPYRFDAYANIRWAKLPPWGRRVMRFLLGEEGYAAAETPWLYDQVRTLLLYAFATLTASLAFIAYLTRPPPPVAADDRDSGGVENP